VIAASPKGAFFAVAEWETGQGLQLRVRRTSDGTEVAPAIACEGDASLLFNGSADRLAVTDDGETVATTLSRGATVVYDVRGRSLLWQGPVGSSLGFEPGAARLALVNGQTILVLERQGRSMAPRANLPSLGFFAWIKAGLAVISRTGVDVWDGRQPRRALEVAIQFDATDSNASSYVAFSADGRYFANETSAGLAVYDLGAGAVLFTRADLKGIFGVAFRGDHARVVWDDTSSDEATLSWASELELPSGRTLSSKQLGKRVDWVKKSVTNPHAGPDGHFIPKLAPSGEFVDLESLHALEEHDIRAL
jgi:hypothetical protein